MERECKGCLYYDCPVDKEPCSKCGRNDFAPARYLHDDRFTPRRSLVEKEYRLTADDSEQLDEEIARWEILAKAYELSADSGVTGQCLDAEQAAECHRLVKWLRELKSLREENRWIPVTERLPKKGGYYFVTMEVSKGVYLTGERYLTKQEKRWETSHPVIAWKKTSEAYKK